jgi:hypothetical protein
MAFHGRVKNGVIVPETGTPALPEGTLVQITPLPEGVGSPAAIITAMEALPRVSPEDVDELERAIEAGQRPRRVDPFCEPGVEPPSKERQEALRSLIGMWRVENPPSDEEVERIIEEYRMKKYG